MNSRVRFYGNGLEISAVVWLVLPLLLLAPYASSVEVVLRLNFAANWAWI